MKRDRVSDNVVVFTSMQYAQVTAGAVLTPEGAVLIDTLPFPDETREIIDYLKTEGPRGVVRYVVNTHRHGDHTHGNYLFPEAEIIGHRLCRETLLKWGRESLDQAKEATPQLAEVELRVPDITFERRCQSTSAARRWRCSTFRATPSTALGCISGAKRSCFRVTP